MKDRKPCIHGNLCRGIYKLTGHIYSIRCPYGCKFYEPVKTIEKGGTKMTKREAYLSFKCWHCKYLENESGKCLYGETESDECPMPEYDGMAEVRNEIENR